MDACAFTAGDPGPLLSGVFWRLVLDPGEEPAADLARRLIVAGGPDSGLLVNPHLHGWLIAGA